MRAPAALVGAVLVFGALGCPGHDGNSTDDAPADATGVDRSTPDAGASPSAPPATWGPEPAFVDLVAPWIDAGTPLLDVDRGTGGLPPEGTTALAGDIDGDGLPEVILCGRTTPNPIPVVLRYDVGDGSLALAPEVVIPQGRWVAAVDLDGDGHLDLFGGERGTDAGPIAWGLGGGAWIDHGPLDATFPSLGVQGFRQAVAVADLDSDGWLDLLMGPNGCCDLDCPEIFPVLRVAERSYRARPDLLSPVNHAAPYAVAALPVAPGGGMLLAALGRQSKCGGQNLAFYREVGAGDDGFPRYEAADPFSSSGFSPLGAASPMGMAAGDVDGDGDLDLAITLDPAHAMFEDTGGGWPLVDRTDSTGFGVIDAPGGEPMVGWGVAFVDLDRDGRADLVTAHGDDFDNPTDPYSPATYDGPMHLTAHWNRGDWTFADVTAALGLGALGDWQALALTDLEGDGDPDLLVGGYGDHPHVLRNDITIGGAGLGLELRGTTSNHLGVGAMVEVRPAGASTSSWHLVGHHAAPLTLTRPRVFAGLAGATEAELVRVHWPSGFEQELEGLEGGQLHVVEEPVLLAVEPITRHLSAGSGLAAVIRVYPRAPDGSIRSDASVEIDVVYGPGEFSGPTFPDDAGWRRDLVSPDVSGETVIEARVDGQPIRVRPRIWWD